MENIDIVPLKQLPLDDIQPLLVESREGGFKFLDRLVTEYLTGINRFQKPGEALFGLYYDGQLIAVGGLNRDPYLKNGAIARVRHVYVLSAWRNQGIGRQLIQTIIAEATKHFRLLTLRTFNDQADGFYRSVGFQTKPVIPYASHHLDLKG